MNRRSFIKSLTTATAASIFLPRAADAFTWKRTKFLRRSSGMWVVNPEWVAAPYRIDFFLCPGELEIMRDFDKPFPMRMGETIRHLTFRQDSR